MLRLVIFDDTAYGMCQAHFSTCAKFKLLAVACHPNPGCQYHNINALTAIMQI